MAIHDRIELDIDVPFYLPNIGIYKIALHLIQALFSLLVSSLVGFVIQTTNHESSQSGSKYTIVVGICSLCIALILALSPISKFGLKSVRSVFLRPRTDLVLNILFSLAWIIVSIIVTTQALEQTTCTHELLLINNSNTSITQCNCIKVAAVFSWLGVFTWIGTVINSLILFCNTKNRKTLSVYSNEKYNIPSSPSSYDADAPTIVEMQYSEKDKQPIASYHETFQPPHALDTSASSMYIPYLSNATTYDQYNPYTTPVQFPHKY